MASNLSTIGFTFDGEDGFMDTMSRLAGEAVERLACVPGDYAIWRSQTGAEVWFHVEGERGVIGRLEEGEVIGFTPWFEARETTRATLIASHKRANENDFEGAFTARLEADGGAPEVDVVFDAVDFAAHDTRPLPLTTRVRLIAFARTVAAERAHTPAIIPVGLAGPTDDEPSDTRTPTAHVLIRGAIREHDMLTNEETGANFHWFSIAVQARTFEVLADPATISGPIAVGTPIVVTAAFFGRVLD